MSDLAPYEELARLAEAGLDLAERGEPAELDQVFERSAAIRVKLPERPPAEARALLERAAAAHERLRTRLGASLAETRAELERADLTRRAARSYGAAAPALLDRSA